MSSTESHGSASRNAAPWIQLPALLRKLHRTPSQPAEPPIIPDARSNTPAELTVELLRQLEWKRFERLTELFFQATGLRAECTCIGPDGGIDLKLYQSDESRPFSYVQCKAWGTKRVPVTEVRQFFGVMAADGIKQGVYFTTTDFYPDARAFAETNGIHAMTSADFPPATPDRRAFDAASTA